METSNQFIKLAMVGLDNAGKTSILSMLEQRYTETGDGMPPTKGIERKEFNFMGFKIASWDFGGQQKYRKRIIAKAISKQYFDDTSLIFFVVDAQATSRFNEVLEFFSDLLPFFSPQGDRGIAHFIVLFHKMDPGLEKETMDKYYDDCESLWGKMKNMAKLAEIEVRKFETSIFNMPSMLLAFSTALKMLVHSSNLLNQQLLSFMETTNSKAVILLDENMLMIEEAYIDEDARDFATLLGMHLNISILSLEKMDVDVDYIMVGVKNRVGIFVPATVKKGDDFFTFILVFIKEDVTDMNLIRDNLPLFIEKMSEVIEAVISE